MLGVAEQHEVVRRQKEAAFEDYLRYEEARRMDEMTDVAERVKAPVVHKDEFFLTAEGLCNARGELLRKVIVEGLEEARRIASRNPDWEVEALRREIDLQEYDEYETLACAEEGSGAMISYWIIPDAVRARSTTLPGYDRERLKMFTRIAVPTARGVGIMYHSYDGSFIPGVAAMDAALGYSFKYGRSSEQVARERRSITGPVDSIDDLDEALRQAYDEAMSREYGREFDSGRPPVAIKDVMGLIASRGAELDGHMTTLFRVQSRTADPFMRNELMEPHRYNMAAFINKLIYGENVASVAEAGDGARSEGVSFDRDCPTDSNARTAEDTLDSLGFKTKKKEEEPSIWVPGECVACLTETLVATNKCDMCFECETSHTNGGSKVGGDAILDDIIRRAITRKRKEAKVRLQSSNSNKMSILGMQTSLSPPQGGDRLEQNGSQKSATLILGGVGVKKAGVALLRV